MSYTVLARKYRPQSFDELVGQEHVARTIANAIAQERVAHAFLFTGVRGVGKTTTARLLAKSLNCEQGPTARPCNACGPCVDITAGRDVDVLEIDGASNNSVDDVRRLQETLPFRPARDRFKIVIVDEVHMLSTGAFNAFLKTLEEPPPHVKFVFATTESHKVPVTIRSRCQRYDFRLIPQGVVAARVREILTREGIVADDGAVGIVAREAAGSMRDALTLLDQLVAFGGNHLVGADVARMLGIAAREQVRSLLTALVSGDARTVVEQLRAAERNGADPLHFGKQVLETMRDLVVFRVTGDSHELVDWVEEERAFATELARNVEPTELSRLFAMSAKVVDEVARASTPMLALEMGFVRVAARPRLGSLEELVAKLEALELRLARGEMPPPGGGAAGPRGGAVPGGGGRTTSTGGTRSASAAESDGGVNRASRPPSSAGFEAAIAAMTESTERGGFGGTQLAVEPSEPSVPARTPPTRGEAAVVDPAPGVGRTDERVADEPRRAVVDERPERPLTAAAPVAIEPPPAAQTTATETKAPASGPTMRRAALLDWAPIVARLRQTHPAVAAIVEQGEARVVSTERIVVGFQEGSFFGRQASQPEALSALTAAAESVLGARPAIDIKLDVTAGAKTRTLADVERQRRDAELEARKREALAHPAVLDALDVFPEARGNAQVRFDGER